MQNLIPGDMLEVGQKLKWELDAGMTADESSVINDAVLAGTQYWKVATGRSSGRMTTKPSTFTGRLAVSSAKSNH